MRRRPGQPAASCARALLACALACALACGAPAAGFADAEHGRVAATSEMAAARELGSPGMVPVTADQVRDGVYDIDAESSSTFFKIVAARLTVQGGQMEATITLRSSSYPLVYLGTGEQAAAAPASDYIPFDEQAKSFTIPVEALDASLDCAAFSKNRKKWYDRKLLFRAGSLPEGALLVDLPDYGEQDAIAAPDVAPAAVDATGVPEVQGGGPEAVAIDLADGEYSIEVNMTGGSGRASVSSPTWLVVSGGRAYARLLWSSTYYDYMILDDVKYLNQTTDGGNSTFIIPITQMNEEIPVIADTTAMGDPVEIEYHLTFYSDTIGDRSLIPQEAAITVLELALVVIVAGGILNYVLKRRRKR